MKVFFKFIRLTEKKIWHKIQVEDHSATVVFWSLVSNPTNVKKSNWL